MISVNGRVPAGSVVIPVVEDGRYVLAEGEDTRYIDKCADKSAKIKYILTSTILLTTKKPQNP